jgi:Transposase DDE domain
MATSIPGATSRAAARSRIKSGTDASIVSAPKQHNSRAENEAIKAGKTSAGWEEEPAKNAQKDKNARWTKKNDKSFYGYKNHISIDRRHKLIPPLRRDRRLGA